MAILSWLWGAAVYGGLGAASIALAWGLLNCVCVGALWLYERALFVWLSWTER